MKLCSPNPYNFTILWILVEFDQQSELFYKTKEGFIGGEWGSGSHLRNQDSRLQVVTYNNQSRETQFEQI